MGYPKISGATLISHNLAEKISFELRDAAGEWWLQNDAMFCYYVNLKADIVKSYAQELAEEKKVRPALIIDDLLDYKVGDEFEVNGYNFVIITNKRALCLEFIGESAYNKKAFRTGSGTTSEYGGKHEDSFDISYRNSEVKKFVDSWFNTKIKPALNNLVETILSGGSIRESIENYLMESEKVHVTVVFKDNEFDLELDPKWCEKYYDTRIKKEFLTYPYGKPAYLSFEDYIDNSDGTLWGKAGETLYNQAKIDNAIVTMKVW